MGNPVPGLESLGQGTEHASQDGSVTSVGDAEAPVDSICFDMLIGTSVSHLRPTTQVR